MLWILRPIKGDPLWQPWYDKSFGFVIKADTEMEARQIAQMRGGSETYANYDGPDTEAWTSDEHSTCVPLDENDFDNNSVIMKDFASA